MRVLITGGAGFIGSHTADLLKAKGYRVRILDTLNPRIHRGWPAHIQGKGFELVRGDVRSKDAWAKALRGVESVIHIAAHQDQLPEFSAFFLTNTVSTALLYELIVTKNLPVKKVVLASTQFVYGDGTYRCRETGKKFFPPLRSEFQLRKKQWNILCPHKKLAAFIPFRESQPPNPTNSYGMSKVALEEIGLRLGAKHGIPTTALRYSIVQGARQSPRNLYSGALRIFVSQALSGAPISVYEDGQQTRDFVNVKDVARANLLALENPKTDFGIFNVGGGRAYRILDFAKMVQGLTGTPSEISLRGEFRATDTRHAVSDIGRLRKLGWRPTAAPETSIKEYVAWIKETGLLRDISTRIKTQQKNLIRMGVVKK